MKNRLSLFGSFAALVVGISLAGTHPAQAQTVLIDFGSDSTYRGVTAPSPDTNGNYWNSTAYGFIGNLVTTTNAATTIDWAPDGLGGVDSYNGIAGATTDPVTVGEIAAAQTILDGGSLVTFNIAGAAMDYYQSNDGTNSVGRFQIQQVSAGQAYDLTFYGAKQYTGANTQTKYSVFDDNTYSNLLGSVTLTHGDGGANANINNVATLAGLIGPSNLNNIFYIQWEGVAVTTEGYINAMSITAVPEPATLGLLAGAGVLALLFRKRQKDGV